MARKQRLKGRQLRTSLLICSAGCFESGHVQRWILQVARLPKLSLIPVIAEEGFVIPNGKQDATMEAHDLELYALALKAVFQEIAVVFVPQNYASTQKDLELRASQAAMRLTKGMKPLSEKVAHLKSRRSATDSSKDFSNEVALDACNESEVDLSQPELVSECY